jgi:hypothetical protein
VAIPKFSTTAASLFLLEYMTNLVPIRISLLSTYINPVKSRKAAPPAAAPAIRGTLFAALLGEG